MNTVEMRESWEDQKLKLKEKFAKLNENNLFYTDDKNEEMLSKLQLELGKSKEDLIKIIDNL